MADAYKAVVVPADVVKNNPRRLLLTLENMAAMIDVLYQGLTELSHITRHQDRFRPTYKEIMERFRNKNEDLLVQIKEETAKA